MVFISLRGEYRHIDNFMVLLCGLKVTLTLY